MNRKNEKSGHVNLKWHVSSYTPEMGWFCEYDGKDECIAMSKYRAACKVYGKKNVVLEKPTQKKASVSDLKFYVEANGKLFIVDKDSALDKLFKLSVNQCYYEADLDSMMTLVDFWKKNEDERE